MDCGEDEKELDDLMELAANIANSSPSIKGYYVLIIYQL